MSFDENKGATRLRRELKELRAKRAELQAQLDQIANGHNKQSAGQPEYHKYPPSCSRGARLPSSSFWIGW